MILTSAAAVYAVTRRDPDEVRSAITRTSARPSAGPPTSAPTTTTTVRDPRRGSGQPVTFAFGGDVHFEGLLRTKLAADPATVLAPITPVLSAADLAMVNLESAITEGGVAEVKEWNFRTPATALDALRAAGVDVVTEANNHGIDYGATGLADSLAARAAKGFPVVGIGANATEAYTPYQVEVKGQRIAMFGATDVLGEEFVGSWAATDTHGGLASTKYAAEARMVAAIQAIRPAVDTIVVYLHWGVERMDCPSPRQQALAQVLTDAGADIVVGSHAHHLQGAGRRNTSFVAYGLGNFVFFNEQGEYGRTGVLTVTATGRDIDSYQWTPARIRGGVPTPLPPGPEADAELVHWNELRGCTGLVP
jgi:Bacterial capsule synthesis protein PGA_cap